MKLDRLETHDRLLVFKKQADYISQGCQDCINNRPQEFGKIPFYIWAHTRTADDGVTKRLIWMPRLLRPTPELNSMLFKHYPESDVTKICWMIPDKSMWNQYIKKNITESEYVVWSIYQFKHKFDELANPENDDLNDDQAMKIYQEIAFNRQSQKLMDNLYL